MIKGAHTDNFYIQSVSIQRRSDRKFDWFLSLCENRSVLHVGCVNSPFIDHGKAEHARLSEVAGLIDGCDTDIEGLRKLKEVVAGHYFGWLEDVLSARLEYDLVLVSNVLEHLANPSDFLGQLFRIRAIEILIVVPNAMTFKGEFDADAGVFREWVHRDHLCWYSPYTFLRTIGAHLQGTEDVKLYFVEEGDDQIAAHIIRPKGFFVPEEGSFRGERDSL